MPGVVQELELLISQLSVNRSIADAKKAGADIGRAIGEAPQVRDAAQKLGVAIQSELHKATDRVKMDMAALAASSSEVRQAVHPMAAAMSQAAIQTTAVGTAAVRATPGVNTIRSGLVQLANQAAGTQGPLSSVINGLLSLAGGGFLAIGIAAGLGVIALAWNKLTEETRKAKEETKKYIDQIRASNLAGMTPFGRFTDEIAKAQQQLRNLTKEFGDIEKGTIGGAPGREVFGGAMTDRQKAILKEIADVQTHINQLTRDWNGLEQDAVNQAEEENQKLGTRVGHVRQIVDLQGQLAKAEADTRKMADDWFNQERARVHKEEEEEAAHQQQLAAKRTDLMGQLRHQLVGLTANTADDLELELHELQVKIIETFGAVPAEVQPLLDDYRRRIEEAKNATAESSPAVKDLGTDWEKVGDTVANVAQGMLDLARGLGLVSEGMDKVLQGAIGIGKNIGGALSGDPGSIIGVVGGVVSVVGGLFGGPDREPARRDENQKLYDAAIKGDEGALERLLMKAGPPSQGGWHSADARTDAMNKYKSAQNILQQRRDQAAQGDKERLAAGEAQRAQDLHDRQLASEESQVALRGEVERKSHITTLLGAGGPGDLTKKLADLEKEFEDLVKRSPLGEDSPLARDAKKRADEAARDLERAVEDAKSEAERQAAEAKRENDKNVSPGFTVQRTLTESSAGRIVGELISQTVWLERIYRQLGGKEGVAGAAVSGPSVQVFIGGEQVEGVVSTRQARRMQDHQSLQGNAGM